MFCGRSAAASLPRCWLRDCRIDEGKPDDFISRVWLNSCNITIPSTAMASKPATLETALLIPEAMPARVCATEFITVVVSGATLMAIPTPRTVMGGKNVVQYL